MALCWRTVDADVLRGSHGGAWLQGMLCSLEPRLQELLNRLPVCVRGEPCVAVTNSSSQGTCHLLTRLAVEAPARAILHDNTRFPTTIRSLAYGSFIVSSFSCHGSTCPLH